MSVFNQADANRALDAVRETMPPNYVANLESLLTTYLDLLRKATVVGSVEDLAVDLYCEKNPDSEDAAMLLKGAEAIANIRAKIDELSAQIEELKGKRTAVKETVAGIRAKAVEQYGEAAKATRSTVSATIGTDLKDAAGRVQSVLDMLDFNTENITIPATVSQATSAASKGKGKSGTRASGPRVKLASATVNGETVKFSGKFPTAGDVAAVIDSKPKDVTAAILEASDGEREFSNLTVTINGKTVVVTSR